MATLFNSLLAAGRFMSSDAPVLDPDFVITVKTDNAGGSNDDQIRINFIGSPDCTVFWGDGESTAVSSSGIFTHTYAAGAGTYEVTITGDFTGLQVNNAVDRLKLLTGENWGAMTWSSMQSAFYGCENLVINATDASQLTVTDASWLQAFQNCTSLVTFQGFPTSLATTMQGMLALCSSLVTVGPLDVSSCENFSNTFVSTGAIETCILNGAKVSFSLASNQMQAAALDDLYTGLADLTSLTSQTVTVTSNPGVGSDDQTIATDKNWTVAS